MGNKIKLLLFFLLIPALCYAEYIEVTPSFATFKAIYDNYYQAIGSIDTSKIANPHPQYVPYLDYPVNQHIEVQTIGTQHLMASAGEIDGGLSIYGITNLYSDLDVNFNDIVQVDQITANTLTGAYISSTITGMGIDMTGDPWYFSGVDYWFNGDITCNNLYSNHQHPQYTPMSEYSIHTHPEYMQDTSKIANAHAVATTLATGFAPILSGVATDFLDGTGAYSVPTNSHSEYVPYSNATATVALGGQHITAQAGEFNQHLRVGTLFISHSKFSKSFVISNPTATADLTCIWRAPVSLTITTVHLYCEGNVIVGNLTIEGSGVDGATDITGVVGVMVNDDGALSAPNSNEGNRIGWRTTSVTGTPTYAIITFEGFYN